MANAICSVTGCERFGRTARTFCLTHYARWLKYGHTNDPQPPTIEERFWAKVDKNVPIPDYVPDYAPELGPCWIWTGGTDANGYGILVEERPEQDGMRRRKKHLAHRWGFERFVGKVPDGLELDHLCRVTACVNFERHLEPVTHKENQRRGTSPMALNTRKTHCLRGHEFTIANTYVGPTAGDRTCRECAKQRELARPHWRKRGRHAA